ncbi:hypothetical protein CBOM_00066 [Ceraceosorus bombacis]|uniref:Uncharacterized protein n=1 Tax=Ceraceosorus bombacis TaxID=401625 RepID=A0A0P1B9M5_9BASI|nr:hypothetical protein CBOM_00066 [Ceraceosorus bombacis]
MPLGARAAPDAPSGSGRPAVGATAMTEAAKEWSSPITVLSGEIEQRHSVQSVAARRKAREEVLKELESERARDIERCKSARDEQWKEKWRSQELKLRSEFATERLEHTKQEAELRHQCDLKVRRERRAMKKEWSRWEENFEKEKAYWHEDREEEAARADRYHSKYKRLKIKFAELEAQLEDANRLQRNKAQSEKSSRSSKSHTGRRKGSSRRDRSVDVKRQGSEASVYDVRDSDDDGSTTSDSSATDASEESTTESKESEEEVRVAGSPRGTSRRHKKRKR